MGVRSERVANAIRKEMGSILQEDLKDPRVGFTTITKVEITADLRNAKIYYSVLGDEKKKKSTEIALNNAKGYIRTLIGKRIKLRLVPEILFLADRTYEHQDRIDEILGHIREQDSSDG